MSSRLLDTIPNKENLSSSVIELIEKLGQENEKLKKDKRDRLNLFDQLEDMLKATRTELETYKSKCEYLSQQVFLILFSSIPILICKFFHSF